MSSPQDGETVKTTEKEAHEKEAQEIIDQPHPEKKLHPAVPMVRIVVF